MITKGDRITSVNSEYLTKNSVVQLVDKHIGRNCFRVGVFTKRHGDGTIQIKFEGGKTVSYFYKRHVYLGELNDT